MTVLLPNSFFLLCACFCATIGAVTDIRDRRIPNALTGTCLTAGLLLHLASGGWKAMEIAALAGLAGGAIFFFFFVIGGMGAGDIKLMAAVAAVAGFGHLTQIFLATAVAGGVLAVTVAVARGKLKTTVVNVGTLLQHHAAYGTLPHPELNVSNENILRLPYGIAIAVGCWATYLETLVR